MQRVPYEGTSRMQTSLRRRQRDRVVRRSVPLPSNSVFNSQPLPKCASTDRVRSSVPEQRSGDDDRGALPVHHCHHYHKRHPHLVNHSPVHTLVWQSDFYATDAGRQHFADQLKSIR